MKSMTRIAVAALLGITTLATTAGEASAAIACNAEGACWHVRRPYAYRPEYGVVVHPDGWRWGPRERYVWREHHGRGYWHNGVWITF